MNSNKIFLGVIFSLLPYLGFASSCGGNMFFIIINEDVNLYEKPSLDSKIVKSLKKGSRITVLCRKNSFYKTIDGFYIFQSKAQVYRHKTISGDDAIVSRKKGWYLSFLPERNCTQ